MLTVYPDERDRMHTKMRHWVNITPEAYIQKPFELDDLLKTVEGLLPKRSGA